MIGGAAVAAAWGAAMHRFTDAAYPWWDAIDVVGRPKLEGGGVKKGAKL